MFLTNAKISLGLAIALLGLTSMSDVWAGEAGRETLHYRLPRWKSLHLDDANAAKSHHATLKRIGCEVEQHPHAGHYDVKYRCPKWRQLTFKNHGDAHDWAQWLKASGFETVFAQPSESTHLETVAFRLAEWKSAHLDRAMDAASQSDTFRMLGCEVRQAQHAGHYDVSYRCAKWRTIGFESDNDAHQWEKWLKTLGFETRDEHKHVNTARVGRNARVAGSVQTTITVKKMHCAGCAKKIAARIYGVRGVKEVRVDVKTKTLVVLPANGGQPSPKAMWEAVEKAEDVPVRLAGPKGVFTSKPKS